MILIVLLYALFASSFTMGKALVTYSSPIVLTGMRMTLGGLILLAYQYFYAHEDFSFRKKDWLYYLQITIFGVYANYILRFWALEFLSSSKTCFLYNFAPFFSALYSFFIFSERPSHKQWLGLAIGIIGLGPILLNTSSSEKEVGEFAFLSLPEAAVLLSVAFHSYSWIVMRKLVREQAHSPIMVNGITMTSAGLLAFITAFFVEWNATWVSDAVPFVGLLILVTLISNIICYNLYGHLLKKFTATFLSFAGFLSPIFAAFYGSIVYHENITWHFYVSGAIVFIGLFLYYQDELKNHIHASVDELYPQ